MFQSNSSIISIQTKQIYYKDATSSSLTTRGEDHWQFDNLSRKTINRSFLKDHWQSLLKQATGKGTYVKGNKPITNWMMIETTDIAWKNRGKKNSKERLLMSSNKLLTNGKWEFLPRVTLQNHFDSDLSVWARYSHKIPIAPQVPWKIQIKKNDALFKKIVI